MTHDVYYLYGKYPKVLSCQRIGLSTYLMHSNVGHPVISLGINSDTMGEVKPADERSKTKSFENMNNEDGIRRHHNMITVKDIIFE